MTCVTLIENDYLIGTRSDHFGLINCCLVVVLRSLPNLNSVVLQQMPSGAMLLLRVRWEESLVRFWLRLSYKK